MHYVLNFMVELTPIELKFECMLLKEMTFILVTLHFQRL